MNKQIQKAAERISKGGGSTADIAEIIGEHCVGLPDLIPCRFCGGEATRTGTLVVCKNRGCAILGRSMSSEQWNAPIPASIYFGQPAKKAAENVKNKGRKR